MYKTFLISLSILILIEDSLSFNCSTTTCACTHVERGIDIECPDFIAPQIKISFATDNQNDFEVNCRGNKNYTAYIPPSLLPTHFEDILWDSMRFKMCSLPPDGGFYDVMKILDLRSTKMMIFQFGNLTGVTRKHMVGFEALENLVVSNNVIDKVPNDLIYDLENLTVLDMKENNVRIPQKFFQHSKKIIDLELAVNTLPEDTTGMFDNLSSLKHLSMWNMQIYDLQSTIFRKLYNLETLELMLNHIIVLPEDIFTDLYNLKNISLRRNRFGTLPRGLFQNNTRLQEIQLQENDYLSYLPEFLFANLEYLKNLELNNCNFSSLPANLLQRSIKIVQINLSNNNINNLPESIFNDQKDLEYLNLENNFLEYLPDKLFHNQKNLKILNLNFNNIKLTSATFANLHNLIHLTINNNNLEKVDKSIFRNLNELQELDLSFNKLTLREETGADNFLGDISPFVMGDYSPFDFPKLERLILHHNQISEIFTDWKILRPKLTYLDLSYNVFKSVSYNDFRFFQNSIEVNLENNLIQDILMHDAEIIMEAQLYDTDPTDLIYLKKYVKIKLGNNPIDCSCHIYDLLRYYDGSMRPEIRAMIQINEKNLICASPTTMIGKEVSKIPSKKFICEITELTKNESLCPPKSRCYYMPYMEVFTMDMSEQRMMKVPSLKGLEKRKFKKIEVMLNGNNLTEFPRPGMGYENISVLVLSDNKIQKFDWLPKHLTALYLDNNNFTYLDDRQVALLNTSRIEKLRLYNNPWACDCTSVSFMKFVQDNYRKIDYPHNITCAETGQDLAAMTVEELCPLFTQVLIIVSITIATVSFIIALLIALYYRYRVEIKVWLYAHEYFLWFVTEEELDRDKTYDAFISYSHKDEEFVINKLLAQLETGESPYKLCVHFRNWLPGEFITTNIARSIADSRRTIVILSENFLESEWGKMEFRTAHIEALKEGRARVIVILLNDINQNNLDDELKAYLNTNTYLKWGDPWFWDKLRYALPHYSKYNYNKSNKIKNKDDRFDLIRDSIIPTVGTTPPADKVVFDPLKNDPFNVSLVGKTLISNYNKKFDERR